MTNRRLPLLVIGGYLGSGKTTLVNRILAETDERLAVVVNDFGDIDIDSRLITAADEDKIELANGCVCCSLSDGLLAVLDRLIETDGRYDRIVIEASGVADPGAIGQYGHLPGLRLDAALVVASAEDLESWLDDELIAETVALQLRRADAVVLSKLDLVSSAAAERARGLVAAVAPPATVVAAGAHALAVRGVLDGGAVEGGGELAAHRTWTWTAREPVTRERFAAMIAALPPTVVRGKGFVVVANVEEPQEFHLVGKRWSLRNATSGADRSEVVFIAVDPVASGGVS